jgi:ADP-heptose:LPS heptosyltransferase
MKRQYIQKNNVLLVNITRLGDMLQATPTIVGMKMENPNCRITVLVEKQFAGICDLLPHIDEVVPLDLGTVVRALAREGEGIIEAFEYIDKVVSDLRSRNFDYCLNMSNSAYTAMLLKMIGIQRHGGWTSDDEGYRVIQSDWAKLFASSVFHTNRSYNTLNLVDIFRCSADVEAHPLQLQMKLDDDSQKYANSLLTDFKFTNTGPLIALQAGASQEKRQWSPARFAPFIKILRDKYNARLVMTGTKGELPIINKIIEQTGPENICVAAGKTSLVQLGALLKECELLVTGDTGTMHMSVAVGTPVVSMFLASALGFETGPYSEGNIVLQPIISCGPCNPTKLCARPDCHDLIDPEFLAELTMARVIGDFQSLPAHIAAPKDLVVFRTHFDAQGFFDMTALNQNFEDQKVVKFREAYRKLWLNDLGEYQVPEGEVRSSGLGMYDTFFEGLNGVLSVAREGQAQISRLLQIVSDTRAPATALREVSDRLANIDKSIEALGFHHPELGPLTRMFIFAKENISGSDTASLASQMGDIYANLARRGLKLSNFYQQLN